MADPSSIVPYDNSHETDHCMDEVLYFLNNNQIPILDDLADDEIPSLYSQSTDRIDDVAIDLLEDPFIREIYNERDPENPNDQGEMSFENNATLMPSSVWPSDPVPYRCSCCQLLRQIVHANGFTVTKLEIHGRLGMICHAILTVEPGPHYQMFDFREKSIEDVKQFLIDYCIDWIQAGFVMIKDPLSAFYEALCVGFGWDESSYSDNGFIPSSSSNSGEIRMDQDGSSNNREKPAKPPLAVQRARTKSISLKDIANYFHLPVEEAAKKLEFSVTVVKNICRRHGVKRWPHRKIQSLTKQMSHWMSKSSSNDPEERARAVNEIEKLKREIAECRMGSSNLGDEDDWL